AQIALALMLLAGAGLMTRSLAAMMRSPLGFDPHGVLTAKIPLPIPKYEASNAKIAFVRELLERVRQLPGVSAAGIASRLPISERTTTSFTVEGHTPAPDEPWPYGIRRDVSPGYFEAMGVPLVAGRLFGDQDSAEAPRAVVVNQALAARYFPSGNAIGSRL